MRIATKSHVRKLPAVTILLVALFAAACSGSDDGAVELTAPPRPQDTAALDPDVAQLIERTLQELDADPDSPMLWGRLAMAYHGNEMFDLALKTYEQTAARQPDNARWPYHKARVRDRLGDDSGAARDLDRAIELDDSYPPAFWRRGERRFDAGDLEAAESDFRRAIELAPDDPTGHVGLARVYIERQEADTAIELLRPLVQAQPEDAYAHLLLGNAYRQVGRSGDAERHLALGQGERLQREDLWAFEVQSHRVSFSAQVQMAVRMMGQGQVDQALPLLEGLRQKKPDDVRVMRQLGYAYRLVGREDEGMATLQEALQLQPDDQKVHLELSSAFRDRGDAAGAMRHIDRAIELKPEDPLAHSRRGALMQDARDYVSAVDSYRTALQYKPADPKILRSIGDCLGFVQKYELAAAAYQQAMQSDPEDPEIYARLGFVMYRLGRYAGAEALLKRALEKGTTRMQDVNNLLEEVQRELASAAG